MEEHRTARGGWRNAQLVQLGESWPPRKGWVLRVIGREISDEAALAFETYAVERANRVEKQTLREKHKRVAKAAKVAALAEKLKTPKPWLVVSSDGFLSSYEWRRVRMVALKKYGARCQCCGATPGTGAVMNVDHIKPRKLFPALAFDVDNLQVLCGECNHGKGNWDQTDWRLSAGASKA